MEYFATLHDLYQPIPPISRLGILLNSSSCDIYQPRFSNIPKCVLWQLFFAIVCDGAISNLDDEEHNIGNRVGMRVKVVTQPCLAVNLA